MPSSSQSQPLPQPQPPPASSSSNPSSPAHSRASSQTSQSRGAGYAGYAPVTPSNLRESQTASSPSSPENVRMDPKSDYPQDESEDHLPALEQDGIHPTNPENASIYSDVSATHNGGAVDSSVEPDLRSRLLDHQNGNRNNGTFSRPMFGRNYESIDSRSGFGGTHHNDGGSGTVSPHAIFGDAITDGLMGGPGNNTSTTSWLAKRHGIVHNRAMYVHSSQIQRGTCDFLKHTYKDQVPGILSPCHQLDPPISVEVPPRRPDRCPDYGFFLHPHVTLVRRKSGSHSSNQRLVFLRLQSLYIRHPRNLSSNDCRPRSSGFSAHWPGCARKHQ